jgi:hypothetical protein
MQTHRLLLACLGTTLAAAPALVFAQEGVVDDGYCDYVKGVAASESALLLAPELFSSFGYVDQLGVAATPGAGRDDLRLTVGVGYSLGGLYRARLTRKRADADCRRYRALSAMKRDSTYQALAARARVLAKNMPEAEARLARTVEEFERRRTTRQELIATRLRVEQLRRLEAETRRQLDAMPAPGDDAMAGALTSYYDAESELEDRDAALRHADAWDINLRMGYDQFLENDDSSPYFAVVSARINLGRLLQGGADDRAAKGRRLFARADGGVGGVDAHRARLHSLLDTERKRSKENKLLLADLAAQLDVLDAMSGEAGERLRRTMWFEWVDAQAEQAFIDTHIATLETMLGPTP